MEEFRTIDQDIKYEISNLARIRNKKTQKILTQQIKDGYKVIILNGKHYRVHRLLAKAFIENPLNKECVDHINCNTIDNNLINLRWVTKNENSYNRTLSKNNKSGCKGVFKLSDDRYRAYIRHNKKTTYLGYFTTLHEAKTARQIKANLLFGEFTNYLEKIKTEQEIINELELEFQNI